MLYTAVFETTFFKQCCLNTFYNYLFQKVWWTTLFITTVFKKCCTQQFLKLHFSKTVVNNTFCPNSFKKVLYTKAFKMITYIVIVDIILKAFWCQNWLQNLILNFYLFWKAAKLPQPLLSQTKVFLRVNNTIYTNVKLT